MSNKHGNFIPVIIRPTKIDIASRYGLSPDNTRGYQFQADPDIDVSCQLITEGLLYKIEPLVTVVGLIFIISSDYF